MRKRLTIFLVLPLMLMSFHARHIIPEQDYRSAITTQYLTAETITAGADQMLCWDKLIATGIVLSLSTNNANHINDIAFVFIGLLSLNTNRRKSHIEYCGKKMVRAIMLQFHPKLWCWIEIWPIFSWEPPRAPLNFCLCGVHTFKTLIYGALRAFFILSKRWENEVCKGVQV